MPRKEIAGGFYDDRAKQFDSQRCVNMYPVISKVENGKSRVKLKNMPGMEGFMTQALLADLSSFFKVLGFHTTADGRTFMVARYALLVGIRIYEIFEDGTYLLRGSETIGTIEIDYVKMSDNGVVLNVVTGKDYSFFLNLSTNSFDEITDPDFPVGVFDVYYKDTYFIWLDAATDRFYVSSNQASDPANCVDALDFGTVESNPDAIKAIIGIGNEIAIFGESTIEYYWNSGNVDFPFDRNSGATQEIGTSSTLSVQKINNEIYFVGSNKAGHGIIYKMTGYQPERISTYAIEQVLTEVDSFDNIFSFTFQLEGQYFYVLTLTDIDKTFCYNANSGLWVEWAQLVGGNLVRHPSTFSTFAFGKNIVADNKVTVVEIGEVGQTVLAIGLFWLNSEKYADDFLESITTPGDVPVYDQTIARRKRTLAHSTMENRNVIYTRFELDIQKGVGNVDDPNPVIGVAISRDGGMSYEDRINLLMGAAGEYREPVEIRGLGVVRDLVIDIESDAPVQQEWFVGYLEYEVLNE